MERTPGELADYLDLAVRAYTIGADSPGSGRDGRRYQGRQRRIPRHLLILDTETTTDRTQRLLFGCWRYVRVEGEGPALSLKTVEEGLFYPDDLERWDPECFAALTAYVSPWTDADVVEGLDSVARLRAIPLSDFLAGHFWRASYQVRAGVVCFNWPFDISRLAWRAGPAIDRRKKRDRATGKVITRQTPDPIAGGFSLAVFRRGDEFRRSLYRPDIGVKSIDSKRAFKRFRSPDRIDRENLVESDIPDKPGTPLRGDFLDLRTLAFALTDRSHSLESACEAFDVRYTKRDVDHGQITPENIDYCREDVAATTALCEATMREFLRHPVALRVSGAYSPATLGRSYLHEMRVRPPADHGIDPRIFGYGMSAYYGGRSECRIRRRAVPVVYCDFLAMYPTVCALMGAWDLLRSERINVDGDARAEVVELLERAGADTWFDPESWPQLLGLAQIEPDDDVLPVRARYGASPSWQIGLNPLTSAEPMWFPIADLVASKLLTGRTPRVLRAIRVKPGRPSPRLRQTRLLGEVEIDPRTDDFFLAIVEQRKRSERDGDEARANGLKVLANATSYGIYAQMTRHELGGKRKERIRVYSDADEPWEWTTPNPEEPGEFCFPPLAASITGAARLMLAMLERLVADRGGSYAFCDTDSMAIVATETGGELEDGELRALSWREVEEIQERFARLKPYAADAVPGSLLELEKQNFAEESENRRQLWCYAISAKRYVLFNRPATGPTLRAWMGLGESATEDPESAEPAARKASQHGLGHLMNPIDPDADDRDWIAEGWRWLLGQDLDEPVAEPAWLDRPALARSTISTPRLLRLFDGINSGRYYGDRIKPFNFMLIAFVPVIERPADEQRLVLVAPYEKDPRRWNDLPWYSRYSGREYRITTEPSLGRVTPGLVCVKTYRDVMTEYLAHPEAKSAGPDDGPCRASTTGLLRRRPVHMRTIAHIGKESNRLEDVEVGLVEDLGEVQSEYDDYYARVFQPLVLPVLRELGVREVARQTGHSLGAVSAVLRGLSVPRRDAMARYTAAATSYASQSRESGGRTDDISLLRQYLDMWPPPPKALRDVGG